LFHFSLIQWWQDGSDERFW